MGGSSSKTKPVEQPVSPRRRSGSSSNEEWRISETIRKRSPLIQQIQRLPILHRKDPVEQPVTPSRRSAAGNGVKHWKGLVLAGVMTIVGVVVGLVTGEAWMPLAGALAGAVVVAVWRTFAAARAALVMGAVTDEMVADGSRNEDPAEQPVTPSSSNSDRRQQELVEDGAGAGAAAPVVEDGSSNEEPVEQPVSPRRRSVSSSNEASEKMLSEITEDILMLEQKAQLRIIHFEESEWTISKRFRKRSLLTQQIQQLQAKLDILQREESEWTISERIRKRSLLTQQIQRLPILHHEDPVRSPMKRSRSDEWLPLNMSQLRVVLLGSSWSERSSVGNFILGETKFITEEEPDLCLRVRGRLKEKEIVLINTPDLLPSSSFHRRLNETCESLSDPGPHVFLILIQPEDFTRVDELELCRFLELFSDQSFDHSLVLISTPREESSAFMERYIQHPPLKEMIRKCKYRFLWRKNLEHPELFTRLGQVVKENNGRHVH